MPTQAANKFQLGRVYGLLEAGVIAGYWRKRDADAAGELISHRYRISCVGDVLLRGGDVALWQVHDVAAYLGVSRQRVDQLGREGRLPSPAQTGRMRCCEREAIVEWAERERWDSRRWRQRTHT